VIWVSAGKLISSRSRWQELEDEEDEGDDEDDEGDEDDEEEPDDEDEFSLEDEDETPSDEDEEDDTPPDDDEEETPSEEDEEEETPPEEDDDSPSDDELLLEGMFRLLKSTDRNKNQTPLHESRGANGFIANASPAVGHTVSMTRNRLANRAIKIRP